ncbi:MAG: AMP-binding protein [Thermodesulfovibrionales bacterium]|jgi:long-chain acyl-CoA synthetase
MQKNWTIPGAFRESAERYRDLIAFNILDREWKSITYGEFFALSAAMAFFFTDEGLAKGQRVAILAENRLEWCAAYMAIQLAGGIAVPIDMHLGAHEVRNLLLDSEAWGVCFSAETAGNVAEALEGTGMREIRIDSPFPQGPGLSGFPEVSPDDIASIIYTSGTTGNPKGVILTHGNLCSDAKAVMDAGIVTHEDSILSILPFHHTYPFMCTFLVPVFLGATITLSPGMKAADMIAAIRERGVTVLVAVPRVLELMRNGILGRIRENRFSVILLGLMRLSSSVRRRFDINLGKLIFSSVLKNFGGLRFCASGGARLDPSVMSDLEALGFTVLEGYGLTETSPVITFNPPEKRKPGSAGKPLPGADIMIGEDGEVMVKGPMVFPGYYRNPEVTEASFDGGWFLTGDLGSKDPEGYLYITGRKKEVIILSSGKTVYPEDVEKPYSSIRLIKEICVTGMEKDGVAEALHGIIVPDMDYARDSFIGNIAEALRWKINGVSQGLPEYMRIKGFTMRQEPLPRTPLGKLRRFMVEAEMARPEPERPADTSLVEDAVGRRVFECIRAVMKEEVSVHSTDNLELDLGFDSLRRLEFLTSLEDAFSLDLPETFIAEVQTVGDVVEGLKAQLMGGETSGKRKTTWADILAKDPEEADKKEIALSFSPLETCEASIISFFLRSFIGLFFRLDIEGEENIPMSGGYIIAPNHESYLDGFLIAFSLSPEASRGLYFIGFQTYFTGTITSGLARLAHVIPIDPETYLQRALQMSSFVLRQGKAMCIFPEGGRSIDGNLMPFKKGIGILALELQTPVIPAHIEGSFEAMPRGARFMRPGRIRVRFGKPLSGIEVAAGEDKYQAFADRLKAEVQKLAGKQQG